jgi:hypothetical protein
VNTDTRRKSSHSGEHDRVEVAIDSMVGVRDTKNRAVGTLTLPADGWAAFLGAVKK